MREQNAINQEVLRAKHSIAMVIEQNETKWLICSDLFSEYLPDGKTGIF